MTNVFRDLFVDARFTVPPLVGTVLIAIVSLMVFMLVMASKDTQVRTADSVCTVGEVTTGSETVKVKLECVENGSVTKTATTQPSSVVTILKAQSQQVVCNVMHTGWARECRIP